MIAAGNLSVNCRCLPAFDSPEKLGFLNSSAFNRNIKALGFPIIAKRSNLSAPIKAMETSREVLPDNSNGFSGKSFSFFLFVVYLVFCFYFIIYY